MRLKIILCLFFVLALPRAGFALDESATALSELAAKVKQVTLSNGMRVILYNRGDAPVFAGVVATRVGGVDEAVGETGISHMLEHMAFKGTRTIGTTDAVLEEKLLAELELIVNRYPKGAAFTQEDQARWNQIQEELSKVWKMSEFDRHYEVRGQKGMNAYTSKDLTVYMVNLPINSFEFWCRMESERLLNPVMRQFYKERDVVMEERRMRFDDDPSGKLYELLLGKAFTVHPYRNPVIGYAEDVSRLTASEVAAFHRKYYVPSNIVLSVIGKINIDSSVKMLEDYFGRIPVGTRPELPSVVEPVQEQERFVAVDLPAARRVYVAYHKPTFPHKDDPAISLMMEMLAGNKLSPLYQQLVEEKRIASSLEVDEAPGVAYPNLALTAAELRGDHSTRQYLTEHDRIIEEFKKSPVDLELLSIAKRSIAMEYLAGLDSNMSLATDLATAEQLFGGWRATLDWYEQAMAVSAEDVTRVAHQYLTRSNRTVGTVEKSTKGSSK